jgi:inosine-uridine nucleoside N-ribohydrolase
MRKVIIDTDPGRDDAAAILLALASPELEIVGIVAVAATYRSTTPSGTPDAS